MNDVVGMSGTTNSGALSQALKQSIGDQVRNAIRETQSPDRRMNDDADWLQGTGSPYKGTKRADERSGRSPHQEQGRYERSPKKDEGDPASKGGKGKSKSGKDGKGKKGDKDKEKEAKGGKGKGKDGKASEAANPQERICHNFKKTGSCGYGNACRFSHEMPQDWKKPHVEVQAVGSQGHSVQYDRGYIKLGSKGNWMSEEQLDNYLVDTHGYSRQMAKQMCLPCGMDLYSGGACCPTPTKAGHEKEDSRFHSFPANFAHQARLHLKSLGN